MGSDSIENYTRNQPSLTLLVQALIAEPAVLNLGGHLKLRFPAHHPVNLAIRNPDNVWFYIQSKGDKESVMPWDEYHTATELHLDTANLESIAWKNGNQMREKVFTTVGEYLIYMADNLETEPENTFHFMETITITIK